MSHTPEVATRSAKMMMGDAFHTVSKAHTGLTKHYLSNKVRTGLAMWSTQNKVSFVTGVSITAGVAIAGIATGGLAIPLLIGLATASWAISKGIEEIGQNQKRANRNWLKRLPSASNAASASHGTFLMVEAGDALRRAVDHYRMMSDIGREVKAAEAADFVTCEEALNHIKAVARFIHHGDKVRNYTLPALDLLIFYLEKYQELATVWATWEGNFKAALQTWFEAHGAHSCCPGGATEDVCYAPFNGLRLNRLTHTLPAKRHPDATIAIPATFPSTDAAAAGSPDAVDIAELLKGMIAAREKIVAGMHQSDAATWNYSAERPATARVSANAPAGDHMHKRRLDAMLDAVWKQVDRPGYFRRGARRVEHWYSRHTTSEKVGAVVSELASVGSIFLPFMGDASALTKLGKNAVSLSATVAVLAGDKVGLNLLKGVDGIAIKSSLLSHALVEAHATEEIRAAGAGVEKMLPKLMLHFGKAAEALKALGTAPPTINSCNDAMALCTKAAEIMSQMEKVSRYAGPCVGMVDVLSAQCFDWTSKEDDRWRDMEARVGEWVRDDEVHQACRHGGKKCYGAKHHRSGTHFGRGGTWSLLTNDPHNPIT
ncbi:hypothetical protein [Caballeronia mineralivorans]|nr:hypothetical protein [Caballeronia mineralivorans]